MLRALPVKEPQRLVQLLAGREADVLEQPAVGAAARARSPAVRRRLRLRSPRFNLARSGEAEHVNGMMASGNFFEVLGVPAILGRTSRRQTTCAPGGKDGPVAVISYGFWQRHYGGAADVVGKSMELDRVPYTIIGVTAPEFAGVDQGRLYDVAIPLASSR